MHALCLSEGALGQTIPSNLSSGLIYTFPPVLHEPFPSLLIQIFITVKAEIEFLASFSAHVLGEGEPVAIRAEKPLSLFLNAAPASYCA